MATPCRSLPFDILIQLFAEQEVPILQDFELRGQRATFKRNELLVCCALVCRTWALAARHVLYRDIALGITFRKDPSFPRYTYGDTTESLAQLTRRLRDDTKLARCVRGLHLGYGFAVSREIGRGISAYTHTYDLHSIAALIAWCPKLTTLTLDIGMRQVADRHHAGPLDGLSFLEKDLARMEKKVKNLRELCIHRAWHESIGSMDTPGLILVPAHNVAQQLLHVFSGSLTHLRIQLPHRSDLDLALTQWVASPNGQITLPRLHTMVSHCSQKFLEDTVAAAPALRRLFVAGNGTSRLAIPDNVTELTLIGILGVVSIGPESQLQSLSFAPCHHLGSHPSPADTSLYDVLLRTLRLFPRLTKLKTLWIPANGFWHPEAQELDATGGSAGDHLSLLIVAIREVFAADAFGVTVVVVGMPFPGHERLQAAFSADIVVQFKESAVDFH